MSDEPDAVAVGAQTSTLPDTAPGICNHNHGDGRLLRAYGIAIGSICWFLLRLLTSCWTIVVARAWFSYDHLFEMLYSSALLFISFCLLVGVMRRDKWLMYPWGIVLQLWNLRSAITALKCLCLLATIGDNRFHDVKVELFTAAFFLYYLGNLADNFAVAGLVLRQDEREFTMWMRNTIDTMILFIQSEQ